MNEQKSKIKEGDSISHKWLGLGECLEIYHSLNGIPIYAEILFDRDPRDGYNMGTNPCIEPLRLLTKIEDDE